MDDEYYEDRIEELQEELADARRLLAEHEAARNAPPPAPPPITAADVMEMSESLHDTLQHEMQTSDDPAVVERAHASILRFSALQRRIDKNRPGRLA